MRILILSRAQLSDTIAPTPLVDLEDFSGACFEYLQFARSTGMEIVHLFWDWPHGTRQLAKCEPNFDEAILKGKQKSLIGCEQIEERLDCNAPTSINLAGYLPRLALIQTLHDTTKFGIDVTVKGLCFKATQACIHSV